MRHLKKAYIAGSLTHADAKLKNTYEGISQICKKFSIETYVPHLWGTDPVKNPDISPTEVWKTNQREIATSNLLIAFVGEPSLGVGSELEISRITMSHIIVWWYKGQKVSRMALGNPGIKNKIEADDEQDLFNKLNEVLKQKYGK